MIEVDIKAFIPFSLSHYILQCFTGGNTCHSDPCTFLIAHYISYELYSEINRYLLISSRDLYMRTMPQVVVVLRKDRVREEVGYRDALHLIKK